MKPGEPIKKDAALARVHATEEGQARSALARLRQAFDINAGTAPPRRLIHE
jgi:thymidine phosphorylase